MMKNIFLLILMITAFSGTAQTTKFSTVQQLNSPYDELNPVLSNDGSTLYFTVANHPQNVGGIKDPGDIWMATWQGTNWSAPVNAGKALNDYSFNGVAGLSPDGKSMVLLSHYGPAGRASTQGIAIAYNTGSGWSKPQNISIPYFQNKSAIISGALSTDMRVFVFSAETYGSYGVEDLYVTLQQPDGSWSAPKNLGGQLNTQFQEVCPSLSVDGQTLYFSSNGRKGMGSFDVYSAQRLDNTWTNWSTPQNMGADINSEGRELYYRSYPAAGMVAFTSTKNSDGYSDIRLIQIPEAQPPATIDTITFLVRETETALPENMIRVFGKVTDSQTQQNIKARITFTNNAEITPVLANANGYDTSLEASQKYSIKIESQGYISSLEKLDMNTYELKTLEMNFKLQPAVRGTTVNLRDVLFEQSTTNLLKESYPELDMVVTFMKENPNVSIELGGHTDSRGVHADNVKLSKERAQKVKDYLVSMGIPAKRMSEKGYGGVKPIANNDNEETRKLNRRVEFTIK